MSRRNILDDPSVGVSRPIEPAAVALTRRYAPEFRSSSRLVEWETNMRVRYIADQSWGPKPSPTSTGTSTQDTTTGTSTDYDCDYDTDTEPGGIDTDMHSGGDLMVVSRG